MKKLKDFDYKVEVANEQMYSLHAVSGGVWQHLGFIDQEKLENMRKNMAENNLLSEETMQKYNELQDLMDEL